MVLWLREGDGASLRVGAAASRRVGGAVIRGRAKRRLREIFRQNRYKLSGSYDVVLVARRGLDQAPWNEVVKEFLGLVQKAGIQLGKEKL